MNQREISYFQSRVVYAKTLNQLFSFFDKPKYQNRITYAQRLIQKYTSLGHRGPQLLSVAKKYLI